jgi:6-pyruvoyltetrahydropterin/6-carboxytetrahydropterin synthase
MFRLTREVRFAVNPPGVPGAPSDNSYGGIPGPAPAAIWSALRVTLAGELQQQTQYLCDIKAIDAAVRRAAIPMIAQATAGWWRGESSPTTAALLRQVWNELAGALAGARLDELDWRVTPFVSYQLYQHDMKEPVMFRLSEKFEFSASHRLHNPALSDSENLRLFGKCSNPLGHGHNYQLQVTVELAESRGESATLLGPLEKVVNQRVIERFDHKNLNVEVAEFSHRTPSVENIAAVIYGLLKPAVAELGGKLSAVKVWETGKTSCEYVE